MALHDAYARRTPYELFLPDEDFADEHFPGIVEELDERAGSASDPTRFVMLMRAGEVLQRLKGPEDDPERIRQHGALLFHAFHFWRSERPLFLLTEESARRVVEAARAGRLPPGTKGASADDVDAPSLLPAEAGYLQLPRHLFWGRVGPEETPESVDGLFWTVRDGMVVVLAALGIREGRPGFTVFDLPPAPLEDWRLWIEQPMREEGADFASALPGAELDELYEVRAPGELLELLILAFRDPAGSAESWPGPPPGAGDDDAPVPSALPFTRL